MMRGRWIELAGETVLLHPERALFCPRLGMVAVADTHFGKDSTFRRAGLAIPEGLLDEDLRRLDHLVAELAPSRLVVLGDLVHAPPAVGDTWPERLARWRARYPGLRIDVVAGNHDRGAATLGQWSVDWWTGGMALGPFALVHDPGSPDAPPGYRLAGHWHPVARVAAGGDRLRLPIFVVGDAVAVLPAFGSFTGGLPVDSGHGTCYAIAGERVVPVPAEWHVD